MCLGKSGFKEREEDPLAVNVFFYPQEEVSSTKSGVKYTQANVENINLFYGQQDLNGHPNWFPREHEWSGAGQNNTQCNREWRLYMIDLYERGLDPELVLAIKRQTNAQKGKTTRKKLAGPSSGGKSGDFTQLYPMLVEDTNVWAAYDLTLTKRTSTSPRLSFSRESRILGERPADATFSRGRESQTC